MYSDMSTRTIASSVSNRNSASALHVSVLPTPVGPEEQELPIGRLGSLQPARERRTASTRRAAPRPARPPARAGASPGAELLALGLDEPRHRDARPPRDDLRDLLGVDLLRTSESPAFALSSSAALGLGELRLELADVAVLDRAAASRSPRAAPARALREASISLLERA
jgi:hypothetical protein